MVSKSRNKIYKTWGPLFWRPWYGTSSKIRLDKGNSDPFAEGKSLLDQEPTLQSSNERKGTLPPVPELEYLGAFLKNSRKHQDIFDHPVIAAMIWAKWNRWRNLTNWWAFDLDSANKTKLILPQLRILWLSVSIRLLLLASSTIYVLLIYSSKETLPGGKCVYETVTTLFRALSITFGSLASLQLLFLQVLMLNKILLTIFMTSALSFRTILVLTSKIGTSNGGGGCKTWISNMRELLRQDDYIPKVLLVVSLTFLILCNPGEKVCRSVPESYIYSTIIPRLNQEFDLMHSFARTIPTSIYNFFFSWICL